MKSKTFQFNLVQLIVTASLIMLFTSVNLIPIYSKSQNNMFNYRVNSNLNGINRNYFPEVELTDVSTKRNSTEENKTEINHPQLYDNEKQYGAIMKYGKMMSVQNGYLSTLKSGLIMNDGTTATPDGYIIKENGAKIKLMEGDYLDSSGKLILKRTNTK